MPESEIVVPTDMFLYYAREKGKLDFISTLIEIGCPYELLKNALIADGSIIGKIEKDGI